MIDVGTRFKKGAFINMLGAISTWKHLRKFWFEVYAFAPDYIHTDARKSFSSEQLKLSTEQFETIVRVAQTEAHDLMGKMEPSHAYLRNENEKICVDLPGISREERV